MKLEIKDGNRCVVARSQTITVRNALRELLRNADCQDEMTVLHTELPAAEQTRFKVYDTGRELCVAINLADTLDRFDDGDGVEIHFDPYHDHVGYYQFYFTADGAVQTFTHLPYNDAHSTAFPLLELKGHQWLHQPVSNVVGVMQRASFLFARFTARDVFRAGPCCGFNVARYSFAFREPQSWNHYTGNGLQDASGLGHLYRRESAPCRARVLDARLEGQHLTLIGDVSGDAAALTMDLCDPHGQRVAVALQAHAGQWEGRTEIDPHLFGRYRLYPHLGTVAIEPEYMFFDVRVPVVTAPFILSMTYDIPDDLRTAPYTPARLEKQMRQLAACGIGRLYWIDYPPYREWPSFWQWAANGAYAAKTFRDCGGDILPVAAELSKKLGLGFMGVFKPFDLGFSGPARDDLRPVPQAARKGWIRDLDGRDTSAWPPIVAHQEWTMQAHPDWTKPGGPPVTRLRIVSTEPLPYLRKSDVVLWTSANNRDFAPYRGPFRMKQGPGREPHYRWTPAGKVAEPGTRSVWCLELDGLKLDCRYAALEVKHKAFRCANRWFLLAAAYDDEGRESALTLASSGKIAGGFVFGAMWSWANYTEALTAPRIWNGEPLGLALAERTRIPTLWDPVYPEVRTRWLTQVERILKTAADGIDIRTLCHHNVCSSWLTYAFAPKVRELFRARFGRDVAATPDDYERVRRLRGEGYTEFVRQAKQLAGRYGKKLSVHIEPGYEVPVTKNTRLQVMLDWETWLREGLVDEITLKYWSAQSTFIHERVLPLARRAGIPVFPSERNFAISCPRGIELAAQMVRDARAAGFSGYTFYETCSYFCMNTEGVSWPIGHADAALRAAAQALRID